MKIYAVILAGGWGRRFWPKSRRGFPKQLLCLGTRRSPIQDLLNIIRTAIPSKRILVVTNKEYAHILRKQLSSLDSKNFLVEPQAKNTAAAVGLAALAIKRSDPQAVTVVFSSDQIIKEKRRFLATVKEASRLAREGNVLVTIGIRPYRAATEFGYLKIARSSRLKGRREKVCKVERFVEKPNLAQAKRYLKNKHYLWNSGIFAWRVLSILEAIKKYMPQVFAGLQRIEKSWNLPEGKKQLVREYARFKDTSIDYGVMEKARNIYAVAADFFWQDLGSWNSLAQGFLSKDTHGNIAQGLHKPIATRNSIVISENNHLIATLGVRDLIIVHTPTATLICKKNQAQKVKALTQALEKDKRLRKFL